MSDEKQFELLPAGKFIIRGKEKFVKGRFSMYMLDRFCLANKIDNYLLLFDKLVGGMRPGEYVDFILMAAQDYYRDMEDQCEWNKKTLSDFIDEELGGLSAESFSELIRHAIGRIVDVKKVEEALQKLSTKEAEDKKKESKSSSTDSSSDSTATNLG